MLPPGEPLLSAAEMAALDARTVAELGVPGAVLMESAAWACVEELLSRWSDRLANGVCCLCGPGNNGGDGMAIARRLHLRGIPGSILLPGGDGSLSPAAKQQRELARRCGVPTSVGHAPPAAGVLVDALFGTGLGRDLEGPWAAAAAAMSSSESPVLAVDIPSGVCGSSGALRGVAVRADCTVTFAALKLGHLSSPGRERCGALVKADIGVPVARWPELWSAAPRSLDARALAPVELGPQDAHKGTFGHLLVVAGGPGKFGAARLCAEAALRAGAGLVTLALTGPAPPGLRPEVMTERIPGDPSGALSEGSVPAILALLAERDALAIGPGLGAAGSTRAAVPTILAGARAPAVVDADALNALAPLHGPVPGLRRVLTPHPGELRRLLDPLPPTRLEQARLLSARAGCAALLKGAGTLIAAPGGAAWLNPTGHAGMATAGSGDVLTGVIGALLARGLEPEQAACAGAFWHGLAAQEAGTTPSLLAGEIGEHLGAAWRRARDGGWSPPFVEHPR